MGKKIIVQTYFCRVWTVALKLIEAWLDILVEIVLSKRDFKSCDNKHIKD